ncbi:MAG: phage Gp37/Gp68 family protein [Candidatus Eisenbacteria bacterium]|nr:phage Gp37/Gp68 family protein [Candidatus Eisenbacteria bacterium]
MSATSSIEWTDATWNPVTGCTKISPGCKHCYALTFSERFRGVPGHPFEQGFDLRLWPERLQLPLAWRKPRRIFVNSMSDLFHERVPDAFILSVFDTMRDAWWHEFQLLTKRPDRMADFVAAHLREPLRYTHPNVWLGTSVETQPYVSRARLVAPLSSTVRFLSCEPLLGPLDLSDVLGEDAINWVIVGGESGHQARPMDAEWVRGIRKQCRDANVPFFFKQWGGRNKKEAGRTLDRRTWDQMPQLA